MKHLWLAALPLFITAQAYGSDLKALAGKYQANLTGIFSSSRIEFLVNGALDIKVLKYTGDEALGIPQAQIDTVTPASDYGPDSVPLAMISFVEGSDEETHTYQFLVTVERDGDELVPRLLGRFYSINDGPNSFSKFEEASSTLLKWNKKTKKYEDLGR